MCLAMCINLRKNIQIVFYPYAYAFRYALICSDITEKIP